MRIYLELNDYQLLDNRRVSIHDKLGLKFYGGGMGFGESTSSSSGKGKPQLTPDQFLQLYNQGLPATTANTANQAAPVANSLAGAASQANPTYTQSGLDQLQQFAPGYAQAGNNLSQINAAGQANLIGGYGGLTAMMGAGLNNLLNPAQAASNSQAANLVNSINLNGLSGGEQSAVERSLNQSNYATGNLGLDNATNAVSNAMNYGNALAGKRAQLGNALGAAAGVSANQQNQVNPLGTALGAGNTANNFGLGTFNPTQANTNLTTPFSFASSLGNQLANIGSASVTKNKSGSQSISGNGSGGACFLTTACCEYKGLPDDCEELQTLRKFRDENVTIATTNRYYDIAPSIVKIVRGNKEYLDDIYRTVKECIQLIKELKHIAAIHKYESMVLKYGGNYAK